MNIGGKWCWQPLFIRVWQVASFIVVQLAHRMSGSSSSQVSFAPSIFFLKPFKISLLADSTWPLLCGRDTELNQIWMLNLLQYSMVFLQMNCRPLPVMMTRGMSYLVIISRYMNWHTCLSVMVLSASASTYLEK